MQDNSNLLANLQMGMAPAINRNNNVQVINAPAIEVSDCVPEKTNTFIIDMEKLVSCDGLRFIVKVVNNGDTAENVVFGSYLGLAGGYSYFRGASPSACDNPNVTSSVQGLAALPNVVDIQTLNLIARDEGLIIDEFAVFGDEDVLAGQLSKFMINVKGQIDPSTQRLQPNLLQANGLIYPGIIGLGNRFGCSFPVPADSEATFELNLKATGSGKAFNGSPKL